MADFTVVNATRAALEDVNAGGIDVPALTVADGITLTAAEALVLVAIPGVAVLDDAATYQDKRNIARLLKYRKKIVL